MRLVIAVSPAPAVISCAEVAVAYDSLIVLVASLLAVIEFSSTRLSQVIFLVVLVLTSSTINRSPVAIAVSSVSSVIFLAVELSSLSVNYLA